jgi:copper chaperone CopZ
MSMTKTWEYANSIASSGNRIINLLNDVEKRYSILKTMIDTLRKSSITIKPDKFKSTAIDLNKLDPSGLESSLRALIEAFKSDITYVLSVVLSKVLDRDVNIEGCGAVDEFIENFNKYYGNYKLLISKINDKNDDLSIWIREYAGECLKNDCQLLEKMQIGDSLSSLSNIIQHVTTLKSTLGSMGINGDLISTCILHIVTRNFCNNPLNIMDELSNVEDKLKIVNALRMVSDEIGKVDGKGLKTSLIKDLLSDLQNIRNSVKDALNKVNGISGQEDCLHGIKDIYEMLHEDIGEKINSMESHIDSIKRLLDYINNRLNSNNNNNNVYIEKINACINKISGVLSGSVKDVKVAVDTCSGIVHYMENLDKTINDSIIRFRELSGAGDKEINILIKIFEKFSGEVNFKQLNESGVLSDEEFKIFIELCRRGILPCVVKL